MWVHHSVCWMSCRPNSQKQKMRPNNQILFLVLLAIGCTPPLLQSTAPICAGQCIGYSTSSEQFACGRFHSDTSGGYPKQMCALELMSETNHRIHLIQMDPGYQGEESELAESPVQSLNSLLSLLSEAGFTGPLPSPIPVQIGQPWQTGWQNTRISVNAISGSGFGSASTTYTLQIQCPNGSQRTENLLPEGPVTFSIQRSPVAHLIALTTTANESEEGRYVHSVQSDVFDLMRLCAPSSPH